MSSGASFLTARVANDGEDVSEKIDHIQVDVEGGEDVFLRRDGVLVFAADHQLHVEHQVEAEEESAQARVNDVCDLKYRIQIENEKSYSAGKEAFVILNLMNTFI